MTLKEEIRAMLAKGRRYLASAELLSRSGDYDSAVSRLYYAMFYAAEALLLSRGRTYASHRAVIGGFAQQFVKSGLLPKEMHRWLHRAFEKRQISDYDYLTGISEEEVGELQKQASEFLDKIEAFLKSDGYLD